VWDISRTVTSSWTKLPPSLRLRYVSQVRRDERIPDPRLAASEEAARQEETFCRDGAGLSPQTSRIDKARLTN
jgi:hypothetical protein